MRPQRVDGQPAFIQHMVVMVRREHRRIIANQVTENFIIIGSAVTATYNEEDDSWEVTGTFTVTKTENGKPIGDQHQISTMVAYQRSNTVWYSEKPVILIDGTPSDEVQDEVMRLIADALAGDDSSRTSSNGTITTASTAKRDNGIETRRATVIRV